MQQSKVVLRPWQRFMLNFGAGLGSLCLVLAILALVLGIKPLVFVSGSMGPSIPTGSLGLAVASSVEEINPGDVVSVINSQEQRITHRVVEKRPEGLVLKGDANTVADLETYAVDGVDKLLFSVPGAGYVVSWLSQPWAYFIGGLLCAYLFYVAFLKDNGVDGTPKNSDEEAHLDRIPKESTSVGRRVLTAVLAILSIGLVSGLVMQPARFQPTQAAFSGSAAATTLGLKAQIIPSVPGALSCVTSGGILGAATNADISWAPVNGLPPGAKYAVRVESTAGEVRYLSVNPGTEKIRFSGGLSLLGLLFGKAQRFETRVLTTITTDGGAVNEQGTNIAWSSPVSGAPTTLIDYKPGVVILDSYSCPKS